MTPAPAQYWQLKTSIYCFHVSIYYKKVSSFGGTCTRPSVYVASVIMQGRQWQVLLEVWTNYSRIEEGT